MLFFAYSAAVAELPLMQKQLAQLPAQSYNAANSNEKRFPSGTGDSSPETGREAFLTTWITTDGSGTPGNNGNKSVKE